MTTTTQDPQLDHRKRLIQAAYQSLHGHTARLLARQRAVKNHRGDFWDGYRDALEGALSDLKDDMAALKARAEALPAAPVDPKPGEARAKWGWIRTHDDRYVSEDGRYSAQLCQSGHWEGEYLGRHYVIRQAGQDNPVGVAHTLSAAGKKWLA